MDFGFLSKAIGIVFRESFEAVLIYGIIISYFKKQNTAGTRGLKFAKMGLGLGVLASVLLGAAVAGAIPDFSEEVFAYIEILIVISGSLMMLYMVFWMAPLKCRRSWEKSSLTDAGGHIE